MKKDDMSYELFKRLQFVKLYGYKYKDLAEYLGVCKSQLSSWKMGAPIPVKYQQKMKKWMDECKIIDLNTELDIWPKL